VADFIGTASLDRSDLEAKAREHLAAAGIDHPSPGEISALTDLSDVELDPGRGFLIQTALESADRIVPVLIDRFIAVIKFPEPGLILPDDPVSLFMMPERASPFLGVGFGTADEIHVPLDRSTALSLHRDESIGDVVAEASAGWIDRFNQSMVWSAGSEIYCHADDVDRLQRTELPDAARPLATANMGVGDVDGRRRQRLAGTAGPRRFRASPQ
jgi:hypothetical protein